MVERLHRRGMLSYLKTLTYAGMHFVVAVTVAYAISRNWVMALGIGLIEPVVQTVAYHLHERFWERRRVSLDQAIGKARLVA